MTDHESRPAPAGVIEKLVPDWKRSCDVCGHKPCVLGEDAKGKIIYRSEMCGCCTFGEAKMLHPENWND